ncbi:MAG: hypothetical protein ACM3UU_02510 [Ignavibacteriales bacterium]
MIQSVKTRYYIGYIKYNLTEEIGEIKKYTERPNPEDVPFNPSAIGFIIYERTILIYNGELLRSEPKNYEKYYWGELLNVNTALRERPQYSSVLNRMVSNGETEVIFIPHKQDFICFSGNVCVISPPIMPKAI